MSDAQLLLRLAKFSAAAYLIREDELRDAIATLDYDYVARVASDECVAVVCTESVGDAIEAVICFQGTRFAQNTDIAEIWDDLNDTAIIFPDRTMVHKGFWEPMARLWPGILAAIPSGCTAITFTGHSLGGVRANLAQRLGKTAGYSVAAVSFGAPKGANKSFWDALNSPPVRVVNRHDFAPLWPPADPRWHQPDPMTWLNKTGTIETVLGWRGILPSVNDHDIDNYIASLEAIVGANLDSATAMI